MKVRRIRPEETAAASSFVQAVVDETYAFIWPEGAPPIDTTDWTPAWVADDDGRLIALMLSSGDCIDDLWVAGPHRGQGLGSKLLTIGESEIRERGFQHAKLRIVAGNELAADFYRRCGWIFVRKYSHDRLPIVMMDFEKGMSQQS